MNPNDLDWTGISGWVGGIGTVLVALWLAVQRALAAARTISANTPPQVQNTSIVTADSVAMQRLTASIEAHNVSITENNMLRREEATDRRRLIELHADLIEVTGRTRDTINEARLDVRELTKEMVRRGG